MRTYNLITEPLLRLRGTDHSVKTSSLPGTLSMLARDAVAEFPGLRAHQRHPWHAFLVQLAALALHRAGATDPPPDEQSWATLLRGLTPEWPGDEPWSLVAPADRPAFMQPPVPGGDLAPFKTVIEAPDALDMLVTSKNHDLKGELMADALPDDWLFALVSLQTMEGFMGQGNYGVSRMNGGFASRPALGVLPPGGPGARFRRDLRVLLHGGREEILRRVPDLKATGGIGLVWLHPWDGAEAIAFADLDPLYIEVCRRVRLCDVASRLQAVAATSKKARIAAGDLKGNTGDPWTPIETKEAKALSITGEGFSYRRMTELMLGQAYRMPILQQVQKIDADDGLSILACSVARGQGKTEGYHERIVPISKEVMKFFRESTDRLAAIARDRVAAAGTLRGKVLRPALFALLQQGPADINYGANSTAAQAERWLDRFERRVDATFFPDLWREMEAAEESRKDIRREWHLALAIGSRDRAEGSGGDRSGDPALALLDEASRSVPQSAMRRYRAKVRSRGLFFGLLYKHFPDLKREDTDDRVA
jgi:CRISPR system Cascade subunit CasA